MERVHSSGEPVEEDVAMTDVLELVHHDETHHAALEAAFPIAREDEGATPHSTNRRGHALGSEENAKIAPHSELSLHLTDERKSASVTARLESRARHKSSVTPGEPCGKSEHPEKPGGEEQGAERP